MKQEWILLDTTRQLFVESWTFDGSSIGWDDLKISSQRLRGGLQEGVDIVTVSSGELSWTVIPTRGMNLWKAQLGDWSVGWDSPVKGPVHPNFVPVDEPGGLGWLDGFDELLARCGLESNGAPEFDDDGRLKFPLHGRIGNRPAHYVAIAVDPEAGTVSVSGSVLESRFHFSKLRLDTTFTSRRGQSVLEIQDQITNLSATASEAQLLYHLNLGTPVLDAGAQFLAPVKRVVPRNDNAATGIDQWNGYPAPQAGIEEQVYFLSLHSDERKRTLAMLKNAHATQACCLRYEVSRLPYFSLWKNPAALEDGYVTGLEPGTNFPNPRSFEGEHDRVLKLAAGGSVELGLTLEFLATEEKIQARQLEIEKLQAQGDPDIADSPQADWCS